MEKLRNSNFDRSFRLVQRNWKFVRFGEERVLSSSFVTRKRCFHSICKFQGIIGYLNYGYLILELSSGCSRWLDRKEESFTFVWIAGRIDSRSFLVD